MDKIVISDLLVQCIIGVNKGERVKKQNVLITVTMFYDGLSRLRLSVLLHLVRATDLCLTRSALCCLFFVRTVSRCGDSDDVNDTIDYSSVSKKICEYTEGAKHYTIEGNGLHLQVRPSVRAHVVNVYKLLAFVVGACRVLAPFYILLTPPFLLSN